MPNTTLRTTTSIPSENAYHNQNAITWLYFDKRYDCLDQTKNQDGVGYSISLDRWHFSYDTVSYHSFLRIQLPYTIFGTHRAAKLRGQAEPQDDKADIHIQKDVASACPSSALVDADIHDTSAKMSWNGGAFDLNMNANKNNTKYVNNLEPPWGYRISMNLLKKCNCDIEKVCI